MTNTCGYTTQDGTPCENPTNGSARCAAGHPVNKTLLVAAGTVSSVSSPASEPATLSADDLVAPSREGWTKGHYEWDTDAIGNYTVTVGVRNDSRRDGYRAHIYPPKNNRVHQGWTFGLTDNHGHDSSSASRRGEHLPEGVFASFAEAKAAAEAELDEAFDGRLVTESWD